MTEKNKRIIKLIKQLKDEKQKDKAFKELVLIYNSLINRTLNSMTLTGMTREDIRQELLLYLYQNLLKFDEKKCFTPAGFVRKLLQYKRLTLIIRNNEYKRGLILNNSLSFDEEHTEDSCNLLNLYPAPVKQPIDILIEREEKEALHNLLNDIRFSKKEKRYLNLIMTMGIDNHFYYKYIMKSGTSRKSMDNTRTRIKIKIDKYLKGE